MTNQSVKFQAFLIISCFLKMEDSFAKELYSESLQLPNAELGSKPIANGDLQDDGGSLWDDSGEELDRESDFDREWQRRRDQFHVIGYRDGLIAGNEASAQEGFNKGFKQSVPVGYNWGVVRGVTSVLACLPDKLKEKLIETQEKRNKFQGLYESLHSISTVDALKFFHDDILRNKAMEHMRASSDVSRMNKDDCSGCSNLENYVESFNHFSLNLLQSSRIYQ